MSSCLSGGTGRAYGFVLETIVKSSSTTSSRNSNSSSPFSTLSESSNSPMAISTRKPRTPRKRPNQTYNEAAALLSSACPTIFSTTKKHNKQSELPKKTAYFFNEPPELLLQFPVSKKPNNLKPKKIEIHESFHESWNCSPSSNSLELSEGYQDDFDTESMLDEETGEGIDSIMGNANSNLNCSNVNYSNSCLNLNYYNTCYGYPLGLGFGGNLEFNFGFGLRNGVRALRAADEGGSWSFLPVNVVNILPPALVKFKKSPVEKKKKVEELMNLEPEFENPVAGERNSGLENGPRLLLKLNYDKVLDAWSDKGSPLPEELSGSESPGGDIHARLAQIDLFSENGAIREASMIRYKEKRRSRLFSKKIRYQVRKVNADRRPRSKGRFVRRPDSPTYEET